MITEAISLFNSNDTIMMSAQSYLQDLYHGFGFKSIGLEYLEDGIPHIKMVRNG